jgi:hypothetical protein
MRSVKSAPRRGTGLAHTNDHGTQLATPQQLSTSDPPTDGVGGRQPPFSCVSVDPPTADPRWCVCGAEGNSYRRSHTGFYNPVSLIYRERRIVERKNKHDQRFVSTTRACAEAGRR